MPDPSGSIGPDAVPSQDRDTLLGRLLRAQGVMPGGLADPADRDRQRARDLANAMTGDDAAPSPDAQPRDTLLTRLLSAQGMLRPGGLSSQAQQPSPPQTNPPVQPPVTVNVVPPTPPLDAGSSQVPPEATGPITQPSQVPDVAPQAAITGPQGPLGGPPTPAGSADQAPPPAPPQTSPGPPVDAVSDAAGIPPVRAPAGPIPVPSTGDPIEDRARVLAERATAVSQALDPATGQPRRPTEDEVAYRQAQLLDSGFRDSVESLARQQAVEEERAHQRLPLQEGLDRASEEVTRQRITRLQEYTRMHRQFWDQARQDQARADARYPNPDQLLGGKGSWSRAVALGIAAAGGGIGMGGAAALVNNQMNLEWAGRTAAYSRERQRMADAAANGSEAANTMNIEDASLVGQQAAAKQRVAEQFELLAARTADQDLRAKYQGLAGKLKEDAAKQLGAFATQMSNRDVRDSQLAMRGMHYDAKLHRWVSMFGDQPGAAGGGGTAAGTAGASNPYGKNGFYDPLHNVYLQAPDPERAREKEAQLEGISKSVRLIDHVLSLQQSQPGLWQKLMNKAGLTDEESAVIQTYEADMIFALNEAHKMKRLTNKEEEIYEKVAADPHSIEKFMPQITSRLQTERTILGEDADEVFRQYGRTSNMGEAPGPPRRRSSDELLRPLGEVPAFTKAGAPAAPNAQELIGTIDSAVEAAARDGETDATLNERLVTTRANLNAAYKRTQGQLLRMVQDRDRLVKSGRVAGVERNAALDSVQQAARAQAAALQRLQDYIDGQARARLERARKQREEERAGEQQTPPVL